MRCAIIVPTYNEAGTIGRLLDEIARLRDQTRPAALRADLDVLVVDDNSPDGTQDLVRAHSGYGEWVRLLARDTKSGLGPAYRAGFGAALDAGYEVALQMDADGSHPVETIPTLLASLRTHDVAIGSRYVPGGGTESWPARRRALSWTANAYARTVLRLRTRDITAGFRAWRATAITAAGVLATTSDGYGFQVENTWRCERRKLRLAEHPIRFIERTDGESKMSAAVAREAATLVLRWRLHELTHPPASSSPITTSR